MDGNRPEKMKTIIKIIIKIIIIIIFIIIKKKKNKRVWEE
jgi:hypothetical protein